jgi:hypothetical protein
MSESLSLPSSSSSSSTPSTTITVKASKAARKSRRKGEADRQTDEQEEEGEAGDEEEEETDLSAHEHGSVSSSTTSPAKKAASTRVKWTEEEEISLLSSVYGWVSAHAGRLPPTNKTAKTAVCKPEWKDIARATSKHTEGMRDGDVGALGKACSLKWGALRTSLKVSRQTGDERDGSVCL